jgi:hypothetical protein
MSVNPQNFVQGPASLYLAVFGSAEPADSTATVAGGPPGGVWVDAGGTEMPVVIEEDVTYADQKVTQIPMATGARETDYVVTVKTMMSEVNVANLQWAMNQLNTVSVNAGYTAVDRIVGAASSQPTYAALIVDGWGPMLSTGAPARWRHIIRKVISKPKIMRNYDPTKMVGYDVTFQSYWISTSITPVHEILQTV